MLFNDPEDLDPDEILDWLDFCSHGLEQTRQVVLATLPHGNLPPGISAESLIGLSVSEIDEFFDSCQDELDLFAILALIASIEAKIRMDAEKRHRTKDNPLSSRLSILFNKKDDPWRIPLYENGILEEWKWYIANGLNLSSSDSARMIGNIGKLKELLDIRHWVAHGRSWTLVLKEA